MNQIMDQPAGFRQRVVTALARLKQRLQRDLEKAHPEWREIIALILEEEELRAWDLTLFPHLLLPDLVEARVAQLNLRAVETKHADVSARGDGAALKTYLPAFAICG
jgi:hypothetical protein